MAKITIIQSDNAVYVDGVAFTVDCSSLPAYFHAIQFDTETNSGHIEYDVDAQGRKMPNTKIVDISPYQYLLDAWQVAKDAFEASQEPKTEE